MGRILKKRRKGFTVAELLIVVAIIAVLVAIAIPIVTLQVEKAREAYAANQDYTRAVVMVAIYPNANPVHIDVYWKNNDPGTSGGTDYVGGNAGKIYPNTVSNLLLINTARIDMNTTIML